MAAVAISTAGLFGFTFGAMDGGLFVQCRNLSIGKEVNQGSDTIGWISGAGSDNSDVHLIRERTFLRRTVGVAGDTEQ